MFFVKHPVYSYSILYIFAPVKASTFIVFPSTHISFLTQLLNFPGSVSLFWEPVLKCQDDRLFTVFLHSQAIICSWGTIWILVSLNESADLNSFMVTWHFSCFKYKKGPNRLKTMHSLQDIYNFLILSRHQIV